MSWPHEVPASAFMTWSLLVALAEMAEMWGEKVNIVSNVTPRILGVLSRGTGELLTVTCGWQLNWLVQGVKNVTEDLSGAMVSLLFRDQSWMGEKASETRKGWQR